MPRSHPFVTIIQRFQYNYTIFVLLYFIQLYKYWNYKKIGAYAPIYLVSNILIYLLYLVFFI